jgi:hypothetical protein
MTIRSYNVRLARLAFISLVALAVGLLLAASIVSAGHKTQLDVPAVSEAALTRDRPSLDPVFYAPGEKHPEQRKNAVATTFTVTRSDDIPERGRHRQYFVDKHLDSTKPVSDQLEQ